MITFTPFHSFQLGPVKIFVWGFILAIAFLVGMVLATKKAKKLNLDSEHVQGSLIYMIAGSFVGARLGYIFAYPYQFSDWLQIFRIWDGGLVFLGGFIGGTAGFYLYAKIKKLDFWKYADLLAPYAALGIAITRIGCFIDWHCYGVPTTLFWGIKVGNALPVHPTQLYHSLANFLIFFVLIKTLIKKKFEGQIFSLFLMLYAVPRFLIDFLREYDYRVGLSVSQYTMIAMFMLGLYLYMSKSKSLNKKSMKEGE